MGKLTLTKDPSHSGYYLDENGNLYVFRFGGRPIKVDEYREDKPRENVKNDKVEIDSEKIINHKKSASLSENNKFIEEVEKEKEKNKKEIDSFIKKSKDPYAGKDLETLNEMKSLQRGLNDELSTTEHRNEDIRRLEIGKELAKESDPSLKNASEELLEREGRKWLQYNDGEILEGEPYKNYKGELEVPTEYLHNRLNSFKNEDYKMTHRPDNDWHMTPDDLLGEDSVAPKDVYEHPEYYTIHSNKNVVKETKEALEKVKGNPDAKITIYRATTGDTINDGDWITLSKSYAEDHNYSQLDGKGKIISKEVPVKDVEWAGDDLSEWGYFPKGEDSKILYHAGDLGIGRDTTYANMTNQSRGTGHFGTGTYFVSSQDELQPGIYKDRPIKAVDISDYNLYKPKNSVEAEHLHDFLKEINNTKWDSEERYSKLVEGKKEYDNLYDDIIEKNNRTYDFSQEDYKKMNDKLEAIFKDSDCYYENREEFTNSYDYRNADPKDEGWYNQFLEEKYNDLKDYLDSESKQWKRIKENVSSQISNDDINKGLEAVKKEYEK